MLTELIQSGMHRGTAIEVLQLVKSRWEIKGAVFKISKLPYFTSDHKLLIASSCTKLISSFAIKFCAFFIHTAHIESM